MLQQFITPGKGIFYAGESLTIEVRHLPSLPGRAVFRSNLPGVKQRRKELIEHHEKNSAFKDLDWHDIEIPGDGSCRTLTLPLTETGVFEGKCCFIPQDGSPLLWAEGENFHFKVITASAIAGNTVYSAFVRQFGRNLYKPFSDREPESISSLEQNGFTVLPPSGTFRQLQSQLAHLFDTLKCRILQLLPIHPVPAEYGRMGRFGSPFAALDYFAVEPSLAEFDTTVTPMEQFEELIQAVHARRGRLFMDIPVNHTGWSSKLQQEHPDYFVRNKHKEFESPGAWGIVWADLCKLDHSRKEVPELMAQVFLFWCGKGVDGFRCDAGYMVPEEAWNYIVAKVRSRYPDTVFLLEGLGGPPEVQERLLKYSGLDWGYSEMFQNYSRSGMEYCLQTMTESARQAGNLISFSETHDNNRLADSGKAFAKFRLLACALLSTEGAFGFANGAEFYAAEKIDVHKDSALNFGAGEHLCALTGKLNTLLNTHPAFTGNSTIRSVSTSGGETMAFLRSCGENKHKVLVLLNPDCTHSQPVRFPGELPEKGVDLLSGRSVSFVRDGMELTFELPPGSGFAVSFDLVTARPCPVIVQEIKVMEQRAFLALKGWCDLQLPEISFADDPAGFVSALSGMDVAPLSVWDGTRDEKRVLPLPAGDLLLVKNPTPFRCMVEGEGTGFINSVPLKDGTSGALLVIGKNTSPYRCHKKLFFESFKGEKAVRKEGRLCLLPEYENFSYKEHFSKEEVKSYGTKAFGSNDNSSYALFPASWEPFTSKYSALLAVNNDTSMPVDRYCLFTGLHIYLVTEGYSRKVTLEALENFAVCGENKARWHFRIPAGQGRSMKLEIGMRFAFSGDAVELEFRRPANSGMPETTPVALILRPEVEDRINHTVTKACEGPEWQFPAAVTDEEKGFTFAPGERTFKLFTDKGAWHAEREWHYQCDLPEERVYGLEDKTDRYSPGYFYVPLHENDAFTLCGSATSLEKCRWENSCGNEKEDILVSAMRRFIVKRGELKTVIAGYPWFLDWGRDTLIALRGLVKVKEFQKECAQILCAFAAFEEQGTIPNVLLGANASNRDTSDAPLYLIIGVRDYIAETKDTAILDMMCGTRPLKQVIDSIIEHYISGTPNGIKMDGASGLVYSPSHFTWMDTNFPAGTPRAGYPVEIQALWYGALKFVQKDELAQQVQDSIEKYFFSEAFEGASDCLHCVPGTPAALAVPDDHIRSNGLLLITLGAVRRKELCIKILQASARLLVPGAIRTLADRKVRYKLPVEYNGQLLNDPEYPYCGRYEGPENECRKKAYHNGTAWCWPFPAFCEALVCCGGSSQKKRALSLLSSAAEYFERAIPGQLSEVADGDAPHAPGGCPAQAWSVTELFRVREILQKL